ncbi:MAG: tetratricopeptide repeat protein [Deltaproteobacteria bacterium]|nr:tetratricopeptide repeat protein [Deltaproteobacteria bacterium]
MNSSQPPSPWIALFTVLLFIAHPIQTQAVTYIVQRYASLATLFYLLSVVCYLKWRLGARFFWYAIALLATILGMKTKEFVFTLPFMILLVEAVFFTKRRWVFLLPFMLTLLIIPFSRFDTAGERELFSSGIPEISPSAYLFTQFRVIVTYLRLLLLPVQQNLDYDYPIFHSLFAPPVLGSFLLLLSLFVLGIKLIRPMDPMGLVGFGTLWFFLTLSAESSIIPIEDLIFEHRVYLPSVGIFLSFCAAWRLGVARIKSSPRRKIFGLLSMGIIILPLSMATYQRNRIWKDELTLWQDVVRKAPYKARGYNNLGNAYDAKGRPEEAIREYQAALQLKPDYADAHNNLGLAYKNQGRWEEAILKFQIALRIQPDLVEAHNNLGNTYKDQGRWEEAIREFRTTLQLKPEYADAHNNLGVACQNQGRWEEAVREFQTAVSLQPNLADPHYNLGVAYQGLGRLEEAIREFQTIVKQQPDLPQARRALDLLKSLPPP